MVGWLDKLGIRLNSAPTGFFLNIYFYSSTMVSKSLKVQNAESRYIIIGFLCYLGAGVFLFSVSSVLPG